MRKLLVLPLLLGFTSAVNAETWYLLARAGSKGATFTIPMESKEDCEEQGNIYLKGKNWKGDKGIIRAYICIKGK